jgi:hypothetical protein
MVTFGSRPRGNLSSPSSRECNRLCDQGGRADEICSLGSTTSSLCCSNAIDNCPLDALSGYGELRQFKRGKR